MERAVFTELVGRELVRPSKIGQFRYPEISQDNGGEVEPIQIKRDLGDDTIVVIANTSELMERLLRREGVEADIAKEIADNTVSTSGNSRLVLVIGHHNKGDVYKTPRSTGEHYGKTQTVIEWGLTVDPAPTKSFTHFSHVMSFGYSGIGGAIELKRDDEKAQRSRMAIDRAKQAYVRIAANDGIVVH